MTNSGQTLPPEILARVREAVDQFDAAWQAVAIGAAPPGIEAILQTIAASERPVFLREFLAIELKCRVRYGEQPNEREYQARFPKHAGLIDEVFHERQQDQAALPVGETRFSERQQSTAPKPVIAQMVPRTVDLPFRPGDVVHDYELLELLGQGGVGAVFKAQHSRLKKVVAIKVLRESLTSDPDAVARFQREMEAVGQLRHPHVVEAHDAGEAEGTHYLVIEYVAGMDVATVIRSIAESPLGAKYEVAIDTEIAPLRNSHSHVTPASASDALASQPLQTPARMISSANACEIIRQAALGLQHAHERGLIHRDIKPSNLQLSTEGIVKVLDLGLARLQTEHLNSALTSFGMVMGTVDYMSPEQIQDSHLVDARADLYSLGCTMYHLLAGRSPYGGPEYSSVFQKMKAHESVTPPAIPRPDIPSGVLVVLDKLLRKKPAERFASAAEVAAALAPFTAGCDLIRLLGLANGADPVALDAPTASFAAPITVAPITSKLTAAPITAKLTEATDLRPRYRTLRRAGWLWATCAAALVVLGLWGLKSWKNSPDSTTSLPASTSPPASTSSSVSIATNESKDPDRAAAEWVLSVGGRVILRVSGNDIPQTVGAGGSLPQEPFTIEQLFLSQQAALPRDELRRLAGLNGLSQLQISACPTFSDDDLLALRPALRNLKGLLLDGTGVTDAGLAAIRDSSDLQTLVLIGPRFSDAAIGHIAVLSRLESLDLGHTQVSDRGLAKLPALPELNSFELGSSHVTGAGMAELSKFPKLRHIGVGAIGLQGFMHLAKLPQMDSVSLIFQHVTSATMDALSKAPKLREINIGAANGAQVSSALFESLARLPHLEELRFQNIVLNSAAWQQLAKLDGLTLLQFAAVPLTDDDLQHLVPLKSLKSLHCGQTKLTPTGLAKFKAARPDVKVESDVAETDFAAERAAAEWVLSVGGNVAVRVGEQRTMVSQPSDLPKEPFTLVEINLGLAESGPFTTDGIQRLSKLRHLEEIILSERHSALELLQQLPEQSAIHGLFSPGSKTNDAVLAACVRCLPGLKFLQIHSGRFSDAGFQQLQKLQQLGYLNLYDTELTDARLAQVAMLPALYNLQLTSNPKLTANGLRSLTKCPRLQHLDLGLEVGDAGAAVAASLPHLKELAAYALQLSDQSALALQDKLTLLRLQGTDDTKQPLSHELTERISRMKPLEELNFIYLSNPRSTLVTFSTVDPEAITALASLPKLSRIVFEGCAIDDANLMQLADFKPLRSLTLATTKVTPVGLAKFKAARPNVTVVDDIK